MDSSENQWREESIYLYKDGDNRSNTTQNPKSDDNFWVKRLKKSRMKKKKKKKKEEERNLFAHLENNIRITANNISYSKINTSKHMDS